MKHKVIWQVWSNVQVNCYRFQPTFLGSSFVFFFFLSFSCCCTFIMFFLFFFFSSFGILQKIKSFNETSDLILSSTRKLGSTSIYFIFFFFFLNSLLGTTEKHILLIHVSYLNIWKHILKQKNKSLLAFTCQDTRLNALDLNHTCLLYENIESCHDVRVTDSYCYIKFAMTYGSRTVTDIITNILCNPLSQRLYRYNCPTDIKWSYNWPKL